MAILMSILPSVMNQNGMDQVQSVFASAELGWNHQLYLTVTGRNDWASQLAFTSKGPTFIRLLVCHGLLVNPVKLPKAISYLKFVVRGRRSLLPLIDTLPKCNILIMSKQIHMNILQVIIILI